MPNPPPVARGPVTQALRNAYRAVNAMPPGQGAIGATAAYVAALQAAARGDRAGALAAADSAQAQALGSFALPPAALPVPASGPAGVAPAATAVFSEGAAGDPDIGLATNEISMAREAGRRGPELLSAEAHLRAACDAYDDGDAKKARSEARTAFDLASDALTRP